MHIGFIFLVLACVLVFYFASYKLIIGHLNSVIKPLNNAAKLFLTSHIIGFSLVYINFTKFSYKIFSLFVSKNEIGYAIGFYCLMIFICFCFCLLIFRLVLTLSKITLKQNEKAELIKGNLFIVGYQILLFYIFSFLLTDPLLVFVSTLIS